MDPTRKTNSMQTTNSVTGTSQLREYDKLATIVGKIDSCKTNSLASLADQRELSKIVLRPSAPKRTQNSLTI